MRHGARLCRVAGILAILALLLALPLQAGMAMPMPHDSAKAAAAAVMPAADDAPMPSCDGCGGDGGAMTMGACYALCGGTLALPPELTALPAVPAGRPAPVSGAVGPGRAGPPDPHPPRPAILS